MNTHRKFLRWEDRLEAIYEEMQNHLRAEAKELIEDLAKRFPKRHIKVVFAHGMLLISIDNYQIDDDGHLRIRRWGKEARRYSTPAINLCKDYDSACDLVGYAACPSVGLTYRDGELTIR